jgi:S-adenosylmethionine:tRNA ribosyltransferase-isomerase
MLSLNNFDYDLPSELIAQYPLPNRTASRLLHLDKTTGAISHRQFTDLPTLLRPNDLLVFNDTKVIPARLFAHKLTGGKIEILIERILSDKTALAHVRSNKSLKIGTKLALDATTCEVEVLERRDNLFLLQFYCAETLLDLLIKHGQMPLPPYIERNPEAADQERYQTVFAKNEGAVAAPTAGLHFDESLLKIIQAQNVDMAFITLHVGAGTFQPIKTENIIEHKMHSEFIDISAATCVKINETKAKGGRVIAVGTTSVRALETASRSGKITPFSGETDIFIYPGYKFKCVDVIITNFHLPKSTLLLLVSAFAGYNNVMNAYSEAVAQKYRFFSYGDAMFISNC